MSCSRQQSSNSPTVRRKVLTMKHLRNAATLAIVLALVVLVSTEGLHYRKFGHFLGYGLHMDIVLGNSDIGTDDTYFARVWNLSAHTLEIEGCRLPGGYIKQGVLYRWDVQRWNPSTMEWNGFNGANNWLSVPFRDSSADGLEGCRGEVTHIPPFSRRSVGWVFKTSVNPGERVRMAIHTSVKLPPTKQPILYTDTFVVR
jgi:hypothetical protein